LYDPDVASVNDNQTNEGTTMTTDAVRNMIQPWLTGNDEKDAQMLRRMFRGVGLSIAQWRQVVAETKAQG
jgi:hypothetical protein